MLAQYSGREPFHLYLSRYFRDHKKLGARDRRQYRALLYSYFRVGSAFTGLPRAQQLIAGDSVMQPPETEAWRRAIHEAYPHLDLKGPSPEIRLAEAPSSWSLQWSFPFSEDLSPHISVDALRRRMLTQPSVFIRVRPSCEERVVTDLDAQQLRWERLDADGAYRLPPQARLHDLASYQEGCFEIQDAHSQQTLRAYRRFLEGRWWDVCAGAGGKTLLMKHLAPEVNIWASDAREAALRNLRLRARRHHIKLKDIAVRDLSRQGPPPDWPSFDGLLVDAPCTGSGTWARTPESRCYPPGNPHDKSPLQDQLIDHALPALKPGGLLLYITCSVYSIENEQRVQRMSQRHGMHLQRTDYIRTYSDADVLFVAALRKP